MAKHDMTTINKYRPVKTILVSCILLAAAGALAFAARNIGGFGEWYGSNIYPVIVNTLGRAAGLIPISVSEVVCLIVPVCIIADIIRNRKKPMKFAAHLLLLVSVIAFMYEADCGVNYYRQPFVPEKVYEDAEFDISDLTEYCDYIIDQLAEEEIDQAEYPAWNELAAGAVEIMGDASDTYPELRGSYPVPKKIGILSGFFSAMGVSGIYSPFAVEANVNGQMPDMEKPFTACHELSHLRGYMNEGEANYIGWLACIGSHDPAFRRSGWLIAWSYAGSQLRIADPEAFEKLYSRLPERVVNELVDNHDFWTSHENKASEVQDKVNDAYLKSNGVEEGVSSYGRLTTLMLCWYRDNAASKDGI